MRVLIIGAGPLGSLYAHLFYEAGIDVTLLARGARYESLYENGIVVRNEMTDEERRSRVKLTNSVTAEDEYDLAIVLIRRNKLAPVFETLASCKGIRTMLFMGNNALGFNDYLSALPNEKLMFGFPGAGGGIRDHVVHYADRETPKGKRRAVTIGEMDDHRSERLLEVKALFEAAAVPVDISDEIDGWLRYHVALVTPLVGALYKHDCDNYRVAKDQETVRLLVRAANEGARVLKSLGVEKGEPLEFKLMRWLPEFMSVMALKKTLSSKFAEIAFAMHATSAWDEMIELTRNFESQIARTSIATPHIDALTAYTKR